MGTCRAWRSALLSGSEYVQRRTGLTYAQYTRSGFFQLVAVVAIVGTVLIASRRIIARSARRRQLLMIALADALFTLVMVVVSIVRLQTYRNVFGLTMLRFSTTVFAAWLGVVIVMIVVALVRTRWEPRLVAAAVVGAYATLLVTNIANPEAIVARENIDRIDWASGATRFARRRRVRQRLPRHAALRRRHPSSRRAPRRAAGRAAQRTPAAPLLGARPHRPRLVVEPVPRRRRRRPLRALSVLNSTIAAGLCS